MATGAKKRIATRVQWGQIVTGVFAVLALLVAVSVLAVPAITSGRSIQRPDASRGGIDADAARWVAVGEFYTAQAEVRQRATDAAVAHWTAVGDFYEAQADASLAPDYLVQHYIAMGEFYSAKAEARQLSEDAMVARWQAMGGAYAARAENL